MIIGIGGGPIFYLKSSLKNQDQVLIYKYKYIIIAPRHQPIIVNRRPIGAPAASTTTHCKPSIILSTTNKIIVDKKSKNIILYNIREKLQAFHLTK